MANILANANGDYHTGATWVGGAVPGVGDTAVLNGKTVTVEPFTTVTCDMITNDPALGAINGTLVLNNTAADNTFTINANLQHRGNSASLPLVKHNSIANAANYVLAVNITGNITNECTATEAKTVDLNSATATSNTVVNVVGDVYTGTYTNGSGLFCGGTNGVVDVNVTGNCKNTGSTPNYPAIYATGYEVTIDISGYVEPHNGSSYGTVNVSNTAAASASHVTIGGGIVPGGSGGAALNVVGAIEYITVGPAADGVAIRSGNATGIVTGTATATITINGDVVAPTSASEYALVTGTSTTVMRTVTINGDVTADNGTSTSGNCVRILGMSDVTVNGDVDGRATVPGSSQYLMSLSDMGGAGSRVLIDGDVYGKGGGIVGSPAINLGFSSNVDSFTITGTITAGVTGPAIEGPGTYSNVIVDMTVGNVQGVAFPSGVAAPYPALSEIPCARFTILGELRLLGDTSFPLADMYNVRFAPTASIVFVDDNDDPQTVTMVSPGAIPLPADVRAGVGVGAGEGTLVVPQASTVLTGVVFDNGTTGTLPQVDTPPIVSVATAVANGAWNTPATWSTSAVPDAATFVYTNGKAVTVDGTVNCAGIADTASAGGVVVDDAGNAALLTAYGDPRIASVAYMAELNNDVANDIAGGYTASIGGSVPPVFNTSNPIGGNTHSLFFASSTNGYLQIPVPALASGTAFTLEWFLYPDSSHTSNRYFLNIGNGSALRRYGAAIEMLSELTSTSGTYTGAVSLSTTAVTHMALVRSTNNQWALWENGLLVKAYTGLTTVAAATWKLFSGVPSWGNGYNPRGWISHVRMTHGVARYAAPFTPPSAPLPQYGPAPGSTLTGRAILGAAGALVQHATSPNASTAGVFQSMRAAFLAQMDAIKAKTDQLTFVATHLQAEATNVDTVTIAADVAYVRTMVETGTYTENLLPNIKAFMTMVLPVANAVSDGITIASSSGITNTTFLDDVWGVCSSAASSKILMSVPFSTSTYTIEAWLVPDYTVANQYLFVRRPDAASSDVFGITVSGGVKYARYETTSGSTYINAPFTAVDGEPLHFAVVANGGVTSIFINGTVVGSYTRVTPLDTTYQWQFSGKTTTYLYNGKVKDLRITAAALYTVAFTPDADYGAFTVTGNVGLYELAVDGIPVVSMAGDIKAKTDQLTFGLNGVHADAAGSEVTIDTTPLMAAISDVQSDVDTVKTVTSATGAAAAAIKAKTDQLAFTVNGVLADAGAADYTARFNDLDAAVGAIPTLTYITPLVAIQQSLDNLEAGGGVDFTPVLSAIDAVALDVDTVGNTASAIKTKTDQLTFTANGVVADVAVSVAQVIDYADRFDALDLSSAGIKAKTDQLVFNTTGVVASASVDTAPIVAAVNAAVAPIGAAVTIVSDDLVAHDVAIKAQLTTIQDATGAIDLTPIQTSLATLNTNVLGIPTLTYTTRFNNLDTAFVALASSVQDVDNAVGAIDIDTAPILDAIAAIDIDTAPILDAIAAIDADVAPVVDAVTDGVAAVNAYTGASRDMVLTAVGGTKTVNIAGVSGQALATAVGKINAVAAPRVTVVPAVEHTGVTLAYAHVVAANGNPAVGVEAKCRTTQVPRGSSIVMGTSQTAVSDVDGVLRFSVPRIAGLELTVTIGNSTLRALTSGDDLLVLPSTVVK